MEKRRVGGTGDSGLLHDKIRVEDPAAASVQTDAEAAGLPTGPDEARASRHEQRTIAATHPQPVHFGAERQPQAGEGQRLGVFLAVTLAALVAIGVIAGVVSLLG